MRKPLLALGASVSLLAVVMLAGGIPGARALGKCEVADTSLDGEESAFISLLNSYRASQGAPAVVVSDPLMRAATWMATDQSAQSNLQHTDSLGRSPWQRMPDCGVAVPGGENLAAGTAYADAAAVLAAWKRSPSHNDVLLARDFTQVGVARVYREGSRMGWYWALDLAYGGAAPAPEPTPAPPPPAPATPPPAPAAPPAVAAAARPILAASAGTTLFTWQGGATPPAAAFADERSVVVAVYAYDPWFREWLRWSPRIDPALQTLRELQPGGQYWVIASAPIELW